MLQINQEHVILKLSNDSILYVTNTIASTKWVGKYAVC